MKQVATRENWEVPRDAGKAAQAEAFLRDLTALVHMHGIGITGTATLFILEPDDASLAYSVDDDSNLVTTSV